MSSILIKNGFVIDGTGEAGIWADVLIHDQKIIQIGNVNEKTDEIIDAEGKVVCPGFVDIHRHCDIMPLYDNNFGKQELMQGVTTAAIGNCGKSMVPYPEDPSIREEVYSFQEPVLGPAVRNDIITYPEYLKAIDRVPLPINWISMIGIGSVQLAVKGFTSRRWTKEELEKGRQIIEEALRAGAAGVTLGIMYIPECYTAPEEYIYLLEPVGRLGKFVAAHVRGEGDGLVTSVQEVLDIAEKANCALEISHFKSCGMKNWRKDIPEAIKLIEHAREAGRDVTCDFYPYEGSSTALTMMLPPEYVAGDMQEALQRLGTSEGAAEYRRAASVLYSDWDNFCVTVGWERIILTDIKRPENKKMMGMSVEEAAKKFGYEDGYALAAYLMHSENGRTGIINMAMCQDDIDTIAKLPYSSVISDTIYGKTDRPHPRAYGTFPKIIREYVNERGIYTLEEGIRRMTLLPAARIGLKDRGKLAAGYWADINIFDPNLFKDHATFIEPVQEATGLDWCLVNGRKAIQNGIYKSPESGKNIRVY